MAKASPIQTIFNGGELGPLVEGRVDSEKHATGMEICLNYVPTVEGPLVRRPGTKRVGQVKDPSKPPVFIPFKVSNKEQYIIEAGEKYMRFYTDEGQIVTSGSCFIIVSGIMVPAGPFEVANNFPIMEGSFYGSRSNRNIRKYELVAPGFDGTLYSFVAFSSVVQGSILEFPTHWDHNMIQNVSWTQKGDTLWIMHSSMPTYTLQRFSPQDWDLKPFFPKDGPYLALNSYKDQGDKINTQLRVVNIVQNDTEGYAVRTHSTWKITNVINNSTLIEVWTQTPHLMKGGDKVWIHDVFGVTAANNGSSFITSGVIDGNSYSKPNQQDSSVWTIQVLTATSMLLLNSVYSGSYVGSGILYPALFNPQDHGRNIGLYIGGHRYFGYIGTGSSVSFSGQPDPFLHPIQVRVALDYDSRKAAFTGSTVATAWQLGAFNEFNGWPSDGTFHQNRLVFNGIPGRPTEFTASKTNDYQTFSVSEASSLSVLATNALQFNLQSESQDFLEWVESGSHGLYFGSESAEFNVTPSREGEALTPTNISSNIIGTFGTSDARPTRSGDAIIYLQNSKKKVRELRFFENLQAHRSTLINQISDHIAYPEIQILSVQKETNPIIWGQRSDGRFVSLSYSRDDSQAIYGWAHHELGGRSDSAGTNPKVKAMEIMRDPTGKYDQLWMAVQRYINGTSVVTVEFMTDFYRHRDPNQKQRDAFYVDCGATYDSSLVIAGITTGSALVTIANHGLNRNDIVFASDVVGLNSSYINSDGIQFNSNIINEKYFIVGSTTTNTLFLQDFNSSIINTASYSPYVSGGKLRKLVSSVGGLTWLKNEEVDILGDGGYQGKQTVNSAGVVTLTNPAAVVQIGYAYKSRVKGLPKDNGSRTGSAQGTRRKTYQVAFKVRDVGDLAYGLMGFDRLFYTEFADGDEYQGDGPKPLFTGIHRDGLEGDVDFYSQLFFEQKTPLPGMIQSITYMMDQYDL